jgi:predicted secreted protein
MDLRASLLFLLAASLFSGCAFERHYFEIEPGKNQVVRAESGDRFYLELEENRTTGYEWVATCDDSDIDVKIVHEDGDGEDGIVGAGGVAKVEIRVHRGYDGPSVVRFRYKRAWEKRAAKEFKVTFFKRTGDTAFWE